MILLELGVVGGLLLVGCIHLGRRSCFSSRTPGHPLLSPLILLTLKFIFGLDVALLKLIVHFLNCFSAFDRRF